MLMAVEKKILSYIDTEEIIHTLKKKSALLNKELSY